jgi:anti-sigma factor RsiW
MQTLDCSEARMSLGVYVLGAIDPAERALVDSHLATCQECRDELAGLAGLPALLARVSADDAIRLSGEDDEPQPEAPQEAPPELIGTVLDLAAARSRRGKWRTAALAAAAVVIVAAAGFGGARLAASGNSGSSSVVADNGPGSAWETASALTPSGEGATIEYSQTGWGTVLAARVVGIPVGTTCSLYVVKNDGSRLLVGSWTTDMNENAVWYPASAAVSYASIRDFQITVGHGQLPITVTPH